MKLFSFEGRRRRRDYWLIGFAVTLGSIIVETISYDYPFISLITYILIFWVAFANGAQRCHDLGHSGWWQLIPFYNLWMAFQNSEPGDNEYGPNPKDNINSNTNCGTGCGI